MSKYCKPMGLYVTYLDCMDCEDKECMLHKREEVKEQLKKIYLQVNIGEEVYLVLHSKREGHGDDVVVRCKVEKATVYETNTIYACSPIKIVTKQKVELEHLIPTFMFENANIDTGLRKGVNRYPVFTNKEKCIEWMKGK